MVKIITVRKNINMTSGNIEKKKLKNFTFGEF